MNLLQMLFWVGAGWGAYRTWRKKDDQPTVQRQTRPDLASGFDISTTDQGDTTLIRLTGSYEDIMNHLNPQRAQPAPPPLPHDLDPSSLPSYAYGCPHCRKMSMYGESLWRYQELSRTRGPYDNTTTFLARCKSCQGLMTVTVDHDCD